MIDPKDFYNFLKAHDFENFIGVPDSLLKYFCSFVNDNSTQDQHIITANEGSAIALASGIYFGGGKASVVYMQNSGLGNTINPLLSLADKKVYSVPMLLLIGWRGEPNVKDEPQHIKQGEVTTSLLESIKLPYVVIDSKNDYKSKLSELILLMRKESKPIAVLVKKDSFSKYISEEEVYQNLEMSREEAIKQIVDYLPKESFIISTTGMTSRELYEYRETLSETHENDFLTVGSMGHSSIIALGISIKNPGKNIVCIDGDGSILMHMGNLGLTGQYNNSNFTHIMLNNGAHDSVGGQPTLAFKIDIPAIASACGYNNIYSVSKLEQLKKVLQNLTKKSFIEIKVKKGNRNNLGRPKSSPIKNRNDFMQKLSENE